MLPAWRYETKRDRDRVGNARATTERLRCAEALSAAGRSRVVQFSTPLPPWLSVASQLGSNALASRARQKIWDSNSDPAFQTLLRQDRIDNTGPRAGWAHEEMRQCSVGFQI